MLMLDNVRPSIEHLSRQHGRILFQKNPYLAKGSLQKKKTKKVDICQLRSDPPPYSEKVDKTFFLSFLKLDHIWGNFGKILFFSPLEVENT